MYTAAQWSVVRHDLRSLRIENANLKRSHRAQKQKSDRLDEENHHLQQEIDRLKKREEELQEKLKETEKQRDTFKGMVFKAKKQYASGLTDTSMEKKTRGGQKGHVGVGRKTPEGINRWVRVFVLRCSDCGRFVSRTDSTDTHTVTDIPHWREVTPVTTQYETERQWCSHCKKEVHGTAAHVIPGSRLGINLVISVLTWKYRSRNTLTQIVEHLSTYYGITITEGALVAILSRTKEWFGGKYEDILTEIRGSPTKHGDETGYRVDGENWWCWVGVSPKSRYYTIEETRGKGVAQYIFKDATGVLVRDDYGAYEKLSIPQQSCWAHLLRKSHEAGLAQDASEEVHQLHRQLKTLYGLLQEDIARPFYKKERKKLYAWYIRDITKIMEKTYLNHDAQAIQTRVKNQNTTLLTALLYPDVPLTNNEAERAVKQIVGIRKITGGSKTPNGAKMHAVNLSVIETIRKQNLPLLDTLQTYLFQGITGKN